MLASRIALALGCLALLAGCGGAAAPAPGPAPTPVPTPAPSPSPSPTGAACSFTAQANFVRDTLNEWYLFPELLDTSVPQAGFTSLQAYVDALVAPARQQSRDRFFTYVTSIAEEDAFFARGTSAGFGFRLLYDGAARRVFVAETFEGTPALGANIDRGSEILAIGSAGAGLTPVSSLMASGGAQAVVNALGPADPGITRILRVRDQTGVEREVSLTKTQFALDPVSDRYGVRIIEDGSRRVGYLNFRTFIDPATADLRTAFAQFRAQGVHDLVIDLRYNGGGALSIAELLGDLMARDLGGQVYYRLLLRASKASLNETYAFEPRAESVAPLRIAFIGTGSTASASEVLINGLQPYLGTNLALIGENTFGKPVGQFGFDLAACDLRLRAVTFRLANRDGASDYYTGLASTVPASCRASDDLAFALGDPREAMLARALDFLAGRPCTPIVSAAARVAAAQAAGDAGLLTAEQPRNVAEREVPGLN